jgi:hypothetical protein
MANGRPVPWFFQPTFAGPAKERPIYRIRYTQFSRSSPRSPPKKNQFDAKALRIIAIFSLRLCVSAALRSMLV